MNYLTARNLFNKNYYSGRNKGKPEVCKFPFGVRYVDQEFLEVQLKLDLIHPKIADESLVTTYMSCFSETPAIFVSLGRLLVDKTVCRFQGNLIKIVDGNHRAKAAKGLGVKYMDAIIPESHWEVLNDDTN